MFLLKLTETPSNNFDYVVALGEFVNEVFILKVVNINMVRSTYIDLKRDLDDWDMLGRSRNACQLDLSQVQVISGHHAVALEDTNDH